MLRFFVLRKIWKVHLCGEEMFLDAAAARGHSEVEEGRRPCQGSRADKTFEHEIATLHGSRLSISSAFGATTHDFSTEDAPALRG